MSPNGVKDPKLIFSYILFPYNTALASSIPVVFNGILQWHNFIGRPMALGSTQPQQNIVSCISVG